MARNVFTHSPACNKRSQSLVHLPFAAVPAGIFLYASPGLWRNLDCWSNQALFEMENVFDSTHHMAGWPGMGSNNPNRFGKTGNSLGCVYTLCFGNPWCGTNHLGFNTSKEKIHAGR